MLNIIGDVMAKKKKQSKNRSKLSPVDRLLRGKARSFLKAEKEFWKYRYAIEEQHRDTAKALDLDVESTIPDEISSVVWALKDGVAFVRHQAIRKTREVSFRSLNVSLEQWGQEGLFVPTPDGEISLAQAGICGLGHFVFHNCSVNNIVIPYAEFRHAYYDSDEMPSPVEGAVIDFQLAFLGAQLREGKHVSAEANSDTITKLKRIASQFETLLSNAEREEDLQIFLKENPMLLHPTAEIIPKKKLGEDFITDFVIVSPSDQGPTYTLVEIEKSSHPILIKDCALSAKTIHAIKQTRDWDVWLEQHKAYLQGNLPGFETPKFLVIIGRSNEFGEKEKAYLRSYNRDWKNTELLSYDDILVRFNGVIEALEKT